MKIVVLTRQPGYTVKRLREAAKARGHEFKTVKFPECYVEIEKNRPDVRYRGSSLKGVDAVIPRILPGLTPYGSSIVRQFEMMGVYTTARSIAISRSRDKLRSLQIMSKYGVNIPKTIFSRQTSEVDDLIDHIGLPMILKLASGTQGNGVVLVETRKAAKSVIQAFYVNDTSFLLQEYIEEAAGADIRAFVIGGQVVACYERRSLDDDFRSNIHQGGQGKKTFMTPEEKNLAIRAAKSMGLSICGVDIIRSNSGPMVLEVNSAPGLEGIESITGVDIATKIIEYVEANAKQRNRKDKVGA
ncbi:30S ribosomal protein S6--L-glutamate ligase [Candidatus Saccharibacteria bacterium]|nr:30S ribosomal protein S6--L-glutamate ligase [Candidatus Saccharibacteria bacterium]MCB9820995.1 30S ribosomal protein S6--L-glutamate ligase [Candidatus Nomurabacteria bacterium]